MTVDAHNHPMIQAMREHVNADRYYGEESHRCLVGQLATFLQYKDNRRIASMTTREFLADTYGLPTVCILTIYLLSVDSAFRTNLEAALWMAERVVAHYLADPDAYPSWVESAVKGEYGPAQWDPS